MSRADEQRVADILDAARELADVISIGREAFLADVIRQRAAERLLEIIGEAANSLSSETTDRFPDVAWRDVAKLRILLAHHYHRVDPVQVWVIASTEVAALVDVLGRSG